VIIPEEPESIVDAGPRGIEAPRAPTQKEIDAIWPRISHARHGVKCA